nr:unnamed protein product [Trichobilharzia regenti]
MSLLKGILELESLELEENALMELIDLPTWLLLRKAHCKNVVAKIHWTKLKTHPVLITIDHIDIEVQALDEPRPASDSPVANYRGGSGKYGFSDKVIDGVTIQVNSILIELFAQAFQGSVELSRFCVMSKSPNWRNCLLNLTTLMLPQYDSILIFKEVTWESARIVADGLLTELRGTPVKLITNQSRIRLTLKKRLSDGALISSRIRLILDDLLWVFTLPQVEAAIVFARSLEHSIHLASEQSKKFAADKAKRQTVTRVTPETQSVISNVNSNNASNINSSSPSTITNPNTTTTTAAANNNSNKYTENYVNAVNMFHQYDVLETSYHVTVSRTELHFCDETKEKIHLIPNVTPNGSIRVNLTNLCIDWYPYHLEVSPELPWPGCQEFHGARDNWLKGLNPVHFNHSKPYKDDSATFSNQSLILDCNAFKSVNTSILQSVGILRLGDISVSCVSYPGNLSTKKSSTNKYFLSHSVLNNPRIHAELPIDKNIFIGSDKHLHNLPETTLFLTIELRNYYHVDAAVDSCTHNNKSLPCSLFCQVNPFYVNFDADTVIWLNVFLLTLYLNLSTFLSSSSSRDRDTTKQQDKMFDLNRYHIRFEALMPRLIFSVIGQLNHNLNTSDWSGPHALVLQADQVIIQSLAAPISLHVANCLHRLVDHLQMNSSQFVTNADLTDNPFSSQSALHQPPDWCKFYKLIQSATESCYLCPNFEEQFWCLHCPNVWVEFLTVVNMSCPSHDVVNSDFIAADVINSSNSHDNTGNQTNECTIYRQTLIESFPVTVWTLLPIKMPLSGTTTLNGETVNSHCPISLLIDIDNKLIPMDSQSSLSSALSSSNRNENISDNRDQCPIKFSLGSIDQLTANRSLLSWLLETSSVCDKLFKLPDALDHMLFLYCIYNQISYLRTHLCLDYQEFSDMTECGTSTDFKDTTKNENNDGCRSQLFYTLSFSTLRPIEMSMNICYNNKQDDKIRNSLLLPNNLKGNSVCTSEDNSLPNTPSNMLSSGVHFFPYKTSSSKDTSSSTAITNTTETTVPTQSHPLQLSRPPSSLGHHNSVCTSSVDSISTKNETINSPLTPNDKLSKLNRTLLRLSMRGRIKSSDDRPETTLINSDDGVNCPAKSVTVNTITDSSKSNNKSLCNPPLIQLRNQSTHSTPDNSNNKQKGYNIASFDLSDHVKLIDGNNIMNTNHSNVNSNNNSNNKPIKQFSEQNLFMLNPVVDDVWYSNASTNNINERYSISSDLSDVQSISSSTDDWIKPYEVLSNLQSSYTKGSNDILWLSHNRTPNVHYHPNPNPPPSAYQQRQQEQQYHNRQEEIHQPSNSSSASSASSLLLGPDEIGSDMLEFDVFMQTPYSGKTQTIEHCQQLKSTNHFNDHHYDNEKFCRWKQSNLSNVIIYLDGFLCEADASNLESRFWILCKSLRAYVQSEEVGKEHSNSVVPAGDVNNKLRCTTTMSSQSSSTHLWSVFLSLGGDPVSSGLSSRLLKPSDYNYPWMYARAVLLANWEFDIPSTIQQLCIQLWKQINTHEGIKQMISNNKDDNNTNCNSSSASPPKCAFSVLMKEGGLKVRLISSDTNENSEKIQLLKQFCLQQGLVITLTENGIFQIYAEHNTDAQVEKKTSHPLNTFNESINFQNVSVSPVNSSSTFQHNILINRYATENKILKDKIEALTAELQHLKSLQSKK